MLNIQSQTQSDIIYNADFEQYMSNKDAGIISNSDDEGHSLGYAPLPFKLNFSHYDSSKYSRLKSTDLPARYDLRDSGLVTSVKNQGGGGFGGNCWTFSTMGAIESQWLHLGYGTFDLSEQNLAACNGFEWGYGQGGNDLLAMAYITRLNGPFLETQDTYDVNQRNCKSVSSPTAFVPEVRWLPNIPEVIKSTILKYGAISTSMTWNPSSFNTTNNTFFYTGHNIVNHAVLIVGWDDNKQTDVGKGAWIIKNQWDSTWADKGYFYISYQDPKVNSTMSYYPIRIDSAAIDTVFMYDQLSTVNLTGFRNSTSYVITKFTPSGSTNINRIGTFVGSAGSIIDIKIYDTKTGDSLSNLLAEKNNIYCELPGFYTFEVPAIVTSDFFVKIKYYSPGTISPIPIEVHRDNFTAPEIITGDSAKNHAFAIAYNTIKDKPTLAYSYPTQHANTLDTISYVAFNQSCDSMNFSNISIYDQGGNPRNIHKTKWNKYQQLLTITHDTLKNYAENLTLLIPAGTVKNIQSQTNDSIKIKFKTPSTTQPQIISSDIAKNNFILNAPLKIKFDRPVSIIKPAGITLLNDSSVNISGLNFSLDTSLKILSITHPVFKNHNAIYTLIIDTLTIKSDTSNDFLLPCSYSFITEAGTPKALQYYPAQSESRVPLTTEVWVKLNQACDSVNFSPIHIKWKIDGSNYDSVENVKTIFDKENNIIRFIFTTLPKYSELFFVVVPSNVLKNKEGVFNKSFYWTFTTLHSGEIVPNYTYPSDQSENNTLDTAILVSFSQKIKFLDQNKISVFDKYYNLLGSTSTLLADGKTVRIKPNVPFAKDERVTVYFPDDVVIYTDGVNWISSNDKEWIAVGGDIVGYEYDLCVRAYATASNKPIALFNCDKEKVCINTSVSISAPAAANVTQWRWSFGKDASLASGTTGKGPHLVSYSSSGIKKITLRVDGPGGSDSLIKFIEASNSLDVIIPFASIEIALGKTDTLIAFGADTLQWYPTYFLDTTMGKTVQISPLQLGSYLYKVYGTTGTCKGYDSVIVVVSQRPVNDDACEATSVSFGTNGPFTNKNASVEAGEPFPPNTNCNSQSTWCYEYNADILKNSVWFKFTAPSNSASFSTDDIWNNGTSMDNQIALYDANTCDDLMTGNYTLIAANDDFFDQTRNFASAIQLISTLTPAKTYWLQVDGSYGGVEGNFYLTIWDSPIGVEDIKTEEMTISPNPSEGVFELKINSVTKENYTLKIYNSKGEEVYSVFNNMDAADIKIDLTTQSDGLYILRYISGNNVVNKLLIKY